MPLSRIPRLRLYCGVVILAAGLWGCTPKNSNPPPATLPVPTQHATIPTTVTEPAEPDTAPTLPPTEPTVTVTEPQMTVAPTEAATVPTQPTVPTAEPTVPVTEPTVPATQPSIPTTEPPETAPAPTETATHHVSFRDHDGKSLAEIDILPGSHCPLPPDPVRSGYVFAGWDGNHRNVTADTVLAALYVPADAPNLFTAESHISGDTVTVTVRLQGSINTCGIECQLDYDETVLEFVSMTKHNSVESNHISPDGNKRLILVWAGASNMTAGTIRDGGVLLEIRFRIADSAAADTWLAFLDECTYVDVVNEDGSYSSAAFTLTKGVVHLK